MNLSRQRIRYRNQASSALVIVLFAVVLATVIILAIMTGAQLERQTSFYYQERIRADIFAQSGLENAIGLLRTGMGNASQSWVSGPGRMVTVTYSASGQSYTTNDLSSDSWVPANTNLTGNYAPPNLNSVKLDGTYPIDGDLNSVTGVGFPMPVRWIYVYQDGTLSQADMPTTSAANPLVGRYAFWIDDSSSRINLNTAWSRGATNTSSPGDVSRINLASVTNINASTPFPADDTHNISSTNTFNSDYDLRSNEIFASVATNRFDYTFYNHSSDGLNPFGQPKIYLTTQIANLPPGFTNVPGYTNNYFDILANDTGNQTNSANDPGVAANLSDPKINAVVNNIASYLTNTTWPEYPGTSFAKKYWGSNSDPRIFQMAVNILEYVRAKESQQEIVCAIKGYVSGGSFNSITQQDTAGNGAFGDTIVGVTRSPIIDEFSLYWTSGPTYLYFVGKVYLPPNCGITTLNSADFAIDREYDDNPSGWGDRFVFSDFNPPPPQSWPQYLSVFAGHFPLNATNRYAAVQAATGDNAFNTNAITTFYGMMAIAPVNYAGSISSSMPMLAWGPTYPAGVGPITLYPTNYALPTNSYQIVDDPLMGSVTNNWQSRSPSWATSNSTVFTGGSTPGSFSGSPPQQDTDGSGLIATNGWRMPYPYNFPCTNYSSTGMTITTNNLTGRMDSLAELGYVSTGTVGWSTSGAANGGNGVPWRTLRLQPANSATLPDWALLDLFALPPASSTNFVYQPYGWTNTANTYSATGGRLNINGLLYPFYPSTGIPYPSSTNLFTTSPSVVRAAPLMALLAGATNPITGDTNYMTANAGALATNILAMTLAGKGQAYDSTNGLYAHIGELAEIGGMADGGESTEGNLFEPLAQTTVSGNVFTVYTIGQALRQTPSGGIVINGEKRYQATIERIPTIPATGTGLFRMVGLRELTP